MTVVAVCLRLPARGVLTGLDWGRGFVGVVTVSWLVSALDLPVLSMGLGLVLGVVVQVLGLAVSVVLGAVPVLRPGT